MSWKSVEMQVALPRVQDAGKIQEQMQQRGQHLQDSVAVAQQTIDEKRKKQVNEFERKDKLHNKKKQEKESFQGNQEQEGDSHEKQESEHPFLGKQIDYSG
ncbi:hypothetical protein [Sediminibacillus albus]|nr:hypothetical protein [Sediminibacillus albus]